MLEHSVISPEHSDISSHGSFLKGYQQARCKIKVMIQGRESKTETPVPMYYCRPETKFGAR